jgi:hypothetical protein
MWEEVKLTDVTAGFIGVTTPMPELFDRIQVLGWNVNSLDFSKNAFVAKASDEHGQKIEAKGNTEATALGNLLQQIERFKSMMAPYTARVAAYGESFVDLAEEIAQEYCDIKSYDKKAAQAWMELAEDCRRRVEIIQNEIDIEITDNPMPYKNYSEMAEDILENGKFTVSRANASHPIWSINQVVDFRIAHDILGHAASGGDWSWFGINRAFEAHANLLSYTAQKALFTETVGQGAFHYYYGSYSTPKIAFLTIFDHPDNPKPYKNAVHPSQTIVPKAMAKIPQDQLIEKFGSIESVTDPNDGYETGIEPLDNNAYAWHRTNVDGQMVDPLHGRGYQDVVKGISSNWHKLDEASQEQAVANAFRNAFLKPGKSERGHAQHYQSINHIPASVDDPSRYWDALTSARDSHNAARGYINANKELDQFLSPLKRHIKFINSDMRDDDIDELAQHHLLNMRTEEEREVKKKLGEDASAEDIYREATKRLMKRLKRMSNDRVHEDYDFDNNRIFFSKHSDPSLYPSPLAHHVKPISDISKNIKNITKDALEDINRGGKGHHFRSSLLKKYALDNDISPDKIDEAWHYLAPETNQLGTITPEILKVLGRKKDDLNLRDYFKAERELMAARDASGYGHMPLGQFSKALKNTMHQSTGHHPDKKHLHNLHPTPHTDVDWNKRDKKFEKPRVPKWFNDTKKARKEVAKDWDKAEGIEHSKDSVPFKKKADAAFSGILNPFYVHPDNKKKIHGQPNQRLMQHMRDSLALSTPEIWALNPEVGREAIDSGDTDSGSNS